MLKTNKKNRTQKSRNVMSHLLMCHGLSTSVNLWFVTVCQSFVCQGLSKGKVMLLTNLAMQ